jgi:NADH-quinone oxidoreductase subunit J
MMLDINLEHLREGFWKTLPIAGPIAALIVFEMVLILGSRHFGLEVMGTPAPHPADYSNTKELGRLIYTDYVYAFELAAVILLVAIVAAIALTLRRRKDSKYIDPAEQVKVKRNDRLRIVKMDPVKREVSGVRSEEMKS